MTEDDLLDLFSSVDPSHPCDKPFSEVVNSLSRLSQAADEIQASLRSLSANFRLVLEISNLLLILDLLLSKCWYLA